MRKNRDEKNEGLRPFFPKGKWGSVPVFSFLFSVGKTFHQS